MKPRIAIYKLSSCAGCQLQILNIEEHLLEIAAAVEIAYFPMARRDTEAGPFAIGFVEGAITSPEQIPFLKQARKDCAMLVALGTCASFGGIPAIKNDALEREVEARVYPDTSVIQSIRACAVDQYVPVDLQLRGCPMDRGEFLEVVKSALLGTKPYLRMHSICNECKLAENRCLFECDQQLCMGPITAAGCGALCPGLGRACRGCRGPSDDPNVESLVRAWLSVGATPHEIRCRLSMFAGSDAAFREGAAMR